MPAVSRNRDHGHKLKNHTILFPICQILSGTEAGKFLKSSFPAGKRTRAAGRERRSQRLPLKGKPLRAGLEPAPTMEQGQFLIVTVPCPFCLHPAPDFPSAEEHARDHCGPDQQDRQVAHKEHDQILTETAQTLQAVSELLGNPAAQGGGGGAHGAGAAHFPDGDGHRGHVYQGIVPLDGAGQILDLPPA